MTTQVKFLADENIDKPIVERLREDGHTLCYVMEMQPGISDDEVLHLANQQEAILLTADKDFGELIFRQGQITAGVVLVRLAGLSPQKKAEVISVVTQQHISQLAHNFTVITPQTIRIRKSIN